MRKKHSMGWNVVKMLTQKVKFHKTVNFILVSVLLSLLFIVLFCFSGGK